jgi:hypothetical protein
MVEEPTRVLGVKKARDVGTLATWDSFSPPKRKKRRKLLDDDDKLDYLKPYQSGTRDNHT